MAAPARRRRRIVVGLDTSTASLAALEAAARLAGELDAEVEGLFVEDVNLVRFAELPFTRVVDAISGIAHEIGAEDMARELHGLAARARGALVAAAGERVAWRFRVVRGSVSGEILAAAGAADLITLGYVGLAPPPGRRAGSLVLRTVLEAPGSVLLLRHAPAPGAPIVACLHGGAKDREVLAYSAALARAYDGTLVVASYQRPADERRRLAASAARRMRGAARPPRYLALEGDAEAARAHVLTAARGGVLAAAADCPLFTGDDLRSLVAGCTCSLLLVRLEPASGREIAPDRLAEQARKLGLAHR